MDQHGHDENAAQRAHQMSERLARLLEFEAARYQARAQKNAKKARELQAEANQVRQEGQETAQAVAKALDCECHEKTAEAPASKFDRPAPVT